ncbi:MAG: hypothetical protein JWR50_2615 [Mucilaginibacter sp.]|nr:hypothetical protein [Mucilaginibacter sp.]
MAYKTGQEMRIYNHLLSLLLSLSFLLAGCRVQKASKLIEEKLYIIEQKVRHDSTLNFNEIEPAILFLEQTTGIRSESNGDYIGRYQPTLNDYKKWKNWFELNRDRLYWDSQEQKVRVRDKR